LSSCQIYHRVVHPCRHLDHGGIDSIIKHLTWAVCRTMFGMVNHIAAHASDRTNNGSTDAGTAG